MHVDSLPNTGHSEKDTVISDTQEDTLNAVAVDDLFEIESGEEIASDSEVYEGEDVSISTHMEGIRPEALPETDREMPIGDESDHDDEDMDVPSQQLYEGSPINEAESILLVSLFVNRHHVSDVAIQDLLKLISLHCPIPNQCPTSLFRYMVQHYH